MKEKNNDEEIMKRIINNIFIEIYGLMHSQKYIKAMDVYHNVFCEYIIDENDKRIEKNFGTSSILFFSGNYEDSLEYAKKVFNDEYSKNSHKNDAVFLIIANYIKLNMSSELLSFMEKNSSIKLKPYFKLYLYTMFFDLNNLFDFKCIEEKSKLDLLYKFIGISENEKLESCETEFEYQICYELYKNHYCSVVTCINAIEDYIKYKSVNEKEFYDITCNIIENNMHNLNVIDNSITKTIKKFKELNNDELLKIKENVIENFKECFDCNNNKDVRTFIMFLNVCIDLNLLDIFEKNIKANADFLLDSKYTQYFIDDILKFIGILFKNNIKIDAIDKYINELLEDKSKIECLNFKEKLLTKELTSHIYNFLTVESKLSYSEAETIYDLIIENGNNQNYINYAMLSLSYYRILEYEINYRIIKPTFNYLKQNLKLIKYKKNNIWYWKDYIGEYDLSRVEDIAINGLMLNDQHRFFKLLSEGKGDAKKISSFILEFLEKILNKKTVEIIKEKKLFYEITLPENIRKYRNPPAHSKFLTKSIAIECRYKFMTYMADLIDLLVGSEN